MDERAAFSRQWAEEYARGCIWAYAWGEGSLNWVIGTLRLAMRWGSFTLGDVEAFIHDAERVISDPVALKRLEELRRRLPELISVR